MPIIGIIYRLITTCQRKKNMNIILHVPEKDRIKNDYVTTTNLLKGSDINYRFEIVFMFNTDTVVEAIQTPRHGTLLNYPTAPLCQ